MALITHEELVEIARYDKDSGAFFRRNPPSKETREIGFTDYQGYRRIHMLGRVYRAHRLAWFYVYGEWPSGEIDHINGIKDDNRIENLRICTHQQNNHNQPIRKNNTSGIKGVHWFKKVRKWHVQVCVNRKIHNGGLFDDIAEAEAAARTLREKLHGEFANHG